MKPKRKAPAPPHGRHTSLMNGLMLLSLAVCLLLYAGTVNGPFIFDDIHNIVNNTAVQVETPSVSNLHHAAFDGPSSRRPIPNLSFALNYILHDFRPFGYHLVNILIHLATGLLLYALFRTILNLPRIDKIYHSSEHAPLIAVIAASLWLIHPLNTQSVSYIVQRMNAMAAMFYVTAMLTFIRARRSASGLKQKALYGLCATASVCAFFSKENAAMLPVFLLLTDRLFLKEESPDRIERSRFVPYAIAIGILVAFVPIYLGMDPLHKISTWYGSRDFTMGERVLTQFRVMIHYISLLILPLPRRLSLIHDFPLSANLWTPPTTLLAILAVSLSLYAAIRLRKKRPLASMAILWFFGNLWIESSIIPLEIMYEHRTYLPAMLPVLAVVAEAGSLVGNPGFRRGLVVTAVCVFCVFSLWTWERNRVWTDNVLMWQDCVAKAPHSARTRYNLGVALYTAGKTEPAVEEYRKALEINPDYPQAAFNLGIALEKMGNLEEAAEAYRRSAELQPKVAETRRYLAEALFNLGRFKASFETFKDAVKLDPMDTATRCSLGDAYMRMGNLDEAVIHFNKALETDPGIFAANYYMGVISMMRQDFDGAVTFFNRAVIAKPTHANARNHLGIALAQTGRFLEAVNQFQSALKLRPDFPEARDNLTRALNFMKSTAQ